MSIFGFAHRAAPAAFALFAAFTAQTALAQSGPRFSTIRVDVSSLRANAGDPTATWVQQELPGRLDRALADRRAPNGAALILRIDYLSLGSSSGGVGPHGSTPDNISGVASIGGRQTPVRAATYHYPSPVDQTMIERSNHDRVSQLVQALAYWIGRGAFF